MRQMSSNLRGLMTCAVLVWAASVASVEAQQPQSIRGGVLDEIELHVPKIAEDGTVLVKLFSAADSELGTGGEGGKDARVETAKRLQERAPKLLADSLVSRLTSLGPFTSVDREDASTTAPPAIVVEGAFSKLDPGSRAKRYFVGFGAGKTTVEVRGTVRDGEGKTLATFVQRRHGAMGMAGGDSADKMVDDSGSIGEDIAKFLSAWAKGHSLK